MDTNKILANAKEVHSYKIESAFRNKSNYRKCIKHIYIARERGTSSYGGFKLIASHLYAGHCYVLERNMKLWFARHGAQHGEGTEMFVFDKGTDAQIKQIFKWVVSNNVEKLNESFDITKVTKSMSKKQQLNLFK